MEGFQLVLRIAEYAAAIGAGIAAINQWIVKPLKNAWLKQAEAQKKTNDDIQKKLEELTKAVGDYQEDVADLLGDRLMTAHDQYMAVGWCPDAEKIRYVEMHKRYTDRGHNHITQKYEEDLLNLPSTPQQ